MLHAVQIIKASETAAMYAHSYFMDTSTLSNVIQYNNSAMYSTFTDITIAGLHLFINVGLCSLIIYITCNKLIQFLYF